MENFIYYTPTEVLFGKDRENEIANEIIKFGYKKVLLHYGQNSVIKSGLLTRIKNILDTSGIKYVELGGVLPNPRLSLVNKGIRFCKENDVNFILAVGGGSVIDSAKAIGYGVTNDGDVRDFYDFKRKPKACLPIGCILTIAATGSEMSNSSVITNDKNNTKRGCNSNYCRLKFAILDPKLTMTLTQFETSCGCCDILMHTMERYFVNGETMEITDAIAEGLMRTVIKNSKTLVKTPLNYEARAEIMWCGSLSHNDLTGLGVSKTDWSTHKLEHELSAKYDVTHGAGLTALWSSWAKYVYKDCLPRFVKFAKNVFGIESNGKGEEVALKGIAAVIDFFKIMNMPVNLHELGLNLTNRDLIELAENCSVSCNGSIGSAKTLNETDMLEIYKNANM